MKSHPPTPHTPHALTRRHLLRATGISLALPLLESLSPRRAQAAGQAIQSITPATKASTTPKRIVCIGNMLGFHPPAFFPSETGSDYQLTPDLEPLAPIRKDITLFSGLDHGVKGGHFAIHAFLSGVRNADAKGMPDGNITLDQLAAETIGGITRFPSLAVGSADGIHGGCMMSWTRNGTRVPPIPGPHELYRKLFISEDKKEQQQTLKRLQLKHSILDTVLGDAKSLQRQLSKTDQEKLDEYFHSIRDVEKQLQLSREWTTIPKPQPGIDQPTNSTFVEDLPLLYDLIALALQTDSTRIATLEVGGDFRATDFGYKKDYHGLSHHGHVQESIDALIELERYQIKHFTRFIEKLKSIPEGDSTLLDHSMVLFGSGMGNANSHTNNNLPIILAGGGYQHGQHKAYPAKGPQRQPLCNLYLSLLQRFGLQIDRFGTSTSTLTDLV